MRMRRRSVKVYKNPSKEESREKTSLLLQSYGMMLTRKMLRLLLEDNLHPFN
jgi:hypothetical protein